VKSQEEVLVLFKKGLHNAFSPVGPEGRPFRRYSDRKTDHWFHSEKNGLSIAGTSFLPPERGNDPGDKTSPVEPTPDGRLRRPTLNSGSADKRIIKSSMGKVVGTTSTPFQRVVV